MKKGLQAGFTVLIVILVSAFLLFIKPFLLKKPMALFAKFDTCGTLQIADPVVINGVSTGTVNSIGPNGKSVIAKLSFPEKFLIPKGSCFEIKSIGLMGERSVAVTLSDSNEFYENGDTIHGKGLLTPPVSEALNDMLSAPAIISQKLDSIIVLLNEQKSYLEKLNAGKK